MEDSDECLWEGEEEEMDEEDKEWLIQRLREKDILSQRSSFIHHTTPAASEMFDTLTESVCAHSLS